MLPRQFRQLGELELGRLQPGLVRVLGGEFALDLVVVDDAALFEVDQQHLARLEPPFAGDLFLRHRQYAGFRGHDHVVVVGDHIARRPQPVAVEGGADLAAIGKGDRRRTVPRLHQRRVVFVKSPPLRLHQRVAGPGLGDQHHHRMGERIAAADDQQLQRVVDAGGVGLVRADQRHHLGQIGAQQLRGHRLAARMHPVDVAAHGVDLAVVAQEPIRMGEPPRREGVGRKALMDQRQRRDGQRVAQILVKAADLRRQQQPLVDDGAGREGRHVKLGQTGHAVLLGQRDDAVQGLFADRQDLALERILIGKRRIGGDDRLADRRHRLDHPLAEPGGVGRHVAPADQRLPLGLDEMLDVSNCEIARCLVARQKAHGDGIAAGRRQRETLRARPIAQQRVRHLDQAAGAVADQRVGPDRAAMIEIDQDLQAALDDSRAIFVP